MEDRLIEILKGFGQKKVLVIGDVMLDRYIKGDVGRISPEAPVGIFIYIGKDFFLPLPYPLSGRFQFIPDLANWLLNFEVKKLNRREQEVFLILYTLEEIKGSVTYLDIARKLCLTEDIVASYISNIIQKGVPIIKRYIANQAHLSLNPKFKALQAKENILQIEQRTLSV